MRFILLALICFYSPLTSEGSDPYIAEGKLVLAHYMTNMVPSKEGEFHWVNPNLSDPNGSTSAIGGLHLTQPDWVNQHPDLTLAQAAELEILTALKSGVDGFQFYYPFLPTERALDRYNTIIRAFITAAENSETPFKITLCLSLGGQRQDWSQAQRIEHWGTGIQKLLADTADSPAWLRTSRGNLVFYQWVSDSFAEDVPHMAQTPNHIERIATAFSHLSDHIGEPIDWVFHVRRQKKDSPYLASIMKHFSAVWGWVDSDDDPAFWDHLAELCHQTGTAYTQTVYPDYFTSKVYAKGAKQYEILSPDQALAAGASEIERHYRQTNLTQTQTDLLRAAITRDAAIINYATWNDWPEGHHLAPEAHHNDGPALLLRHFAAKWKGLPSPFADQNVAAIFYKLHPSTAIPTHPIHVRTDSQLNTPNEEDKIELVTWLQHPGTATIADLPPQRIPAGFQITEFPLPTKSTHLRTRIDSTNIDFAPLKKFALTPQRTNRLTISSSSLP